MIAHKFTQYILTVLDVNDREPWWEQTYQLPLWSATSFEIVSAAFKEISWNFNLFQANAPALVLAHATAGSIFLAGWHRKDRLASRVSRIFAAIQHTNIRACPKRSDFPTIWKLWMFKRCARYKFYQILFFYACLLGETMPGEIFWELRHTAVLCSCSSFLTRLGLGILWRLQFLFRAPILEWEGVLADWGDERSDVTVQTISIKYVRSRETLGSKRYPVAASLKRFFGLKVSLSSENRV